jgi:hypothetical protein
MNEAALEAYNKSIKKRASGAVWREKVDIAQVSISPLNIQILSIFIVFILATFLCPFSSFSNFKLNKNKNISVFTIER